MPTNWNLAQAVAAMDRPQALAATDDKGNKVERNGSARVPVQ